MNLGFLMIFRSFSCLAAAAVLLAAPSAWAGFSMSTGQIFFEDDKPHFELHRDKSKPIEFRLYRVKDPLGFMVNQSSPHNPVTNNQYEVTDPGDAMTLLKKRMVFEFRRAARDIFSPQSRIEVGDKLGVRASPSDPPRPAGIPEYPILKEHELVKQWKLETSKDKSWSEKIPLEVKAGFYIIEGVQAGHIASTVLMVSNLRFIHKRDAKRSVIFVTDGVTGQPVAGARVMTWRAHVGDKRILECKTGDTGLCEIPMRENTPPAEGGEDYEQVYVGVEKDSQLVMGNPYYYGDSWSKKRVFLYTDRPVYRPGHAVYFKGLFRRREDGKYLVDPGETIQIKVYDSRRGEIFSASQPLSAAGTLSGSLTLNEEAPLGMYEIEARYRDQTYTGEFAVEEYKKPEFEVSVRPAVKTAIIGETVKVEGDARYYFGEPVTAGSAQVYIYRKRFYRPWWADFGYDWYFEGEDGWSWYDWSLEQDIESVKLDGDGKYNFSFKPGNPGEDSVYRVEVRVTDVSRRQISGSATFKVFRASRWLTIQADQWSYQPGDDARLKLRVRDHDEQMVGGAAVIILKSREWTGKDYRETEVRRINVNVPASGEAEVAIKLEKAGYYLAEAQFKDDKGRLTSDSVSLWVYSSSWRYNRNDQQLSLILDKAAYKPGGKARLIAMSNQKDAWFLVTIEGAMLHQVIPVRASDGAIALELDVLEQYQPNVFVKAQTFSGKSSLAGEKMLIIPPEERFLTVSARAAKDTYKPGEEVEVEIVTLDHKGAGVPAEVSLSVVDEAVYAIVPDTLEDLRKFFYARAGNQVATFTAGYFWINSQSRGEKKFPDWAARAVASDKNRDTAPVTIRKNFKDTAHWEAAVTTGPDGKAKIRFQAPDNLTTWRLTARVITADTRVGEARSKFIARKNLMARLETPRFFRQRDKSTLTAIVHNYLPNEQQVQLSLDVKGLETAGEVKSVFALPPKGEKAVDFPVSASRPGEAIITIKALAQDESDGMELRVPVLPYGARQVVTHAAALAEDGESATLTWDLPANVVEGTGSLRIELAPSVAAAALGAIDYLVGYPYGCVEQTMSRFLPNLIAWKALERLKIQNEKLAKEIPVMTQKGLKRLYNFQHGDGGWGWWENDPTHPYMTAYVVYGLSVARESGFEVNDDIYRRGIENLRQQLQNVKLPPSTRVFMAYALAHTPQADVKELDGLYAKRNELKLNSHARAMLAVAMHRVRNQPPVEELEKEILAQAKNRGGQLYWEDPTETGLVHWQDDPVETTSFAVRTLMRGGPKLKEASGSVQWLLERRVGANHWKSTRDTANAVIALIEYVETSKELENRPTGNVALNGQSLSPLPGAGPLSPVRFQVPRSALKPGANSLTVNKSGKGVLNVSGSLEYYTMEDAMRPIESGFAVERFFYKLSPVKRGGKLVHARTPLKNGDTIQTGDEIQSEVRVKGPANVEYFMLEDHFPSGFEPVKNDADYVIENSVTAGTYNRWMYNPQRELRDEKAVFFLGELWETRNTYRTVLRAQIPGSYQIMPAIGSLMYFPDKQGSSTNFVLNVSAPPEKK
ncbi:MAG: hypothetical protein GMKNLPBB_02110 [Myxococcota bacterium]|nr:hypothetical protein [Myxococcota bacterium]